jgi:hypothetical protein
MKDELLLDKIIYSIKDENLRRILWEDREKTLTQAINKCKARESTENQLKSIRPNAEEINCGMDHMKSQICPAKEVECSVCHKMDHFAKKACRKDIL